MSQWVLVKKDNGFFVAKQGRENAYTNDLSYAQKFKNLQEAQNNACGNETPVCIQQFISPMLKP